MGMKELKDFFFILFMYIKMNILLKMKKFGYLDFIEKIVEFFCFFMEKDEFIFYVK